MGHGGVGVEYPVSFEALVEELRLTPTRRLSVEENYRTLLNAARYIGLVGRPRADYTPKRITPEHGVWHAVITVLRERRD